MSKSRRSYEVTEKDLLAALQTLLQTQHHDSITVTDICRKAGYTTQAFYNHFNDIRDCAQKLCEEQVQKDKSELLLINTVNIFCVFCHDRLSMGARLQSALDLSERNQQWSRILFEMVSTYFENTAQFRMLTITDTDLKRAAMLYSSFLFQALYTDNVPETEELREYLYFLLPELRP